MSTEKPYRSPGQLEREWKQEFGDHTECPVCGSQCRDLFLGLDLADAIRTAQRETLDVVADMLRSKARDRTYSPTKVELIHTCVSWIEALKERRCTHEYERKRQSAPGEPDEIFITCKHCGESEWSPEFNEERRTNSGGGKETERRADVP